MSTDHTLHLHETQPDDPAIDTSRILVGFLEGEEGGPSQPYKLRVHPGDESYLEIQRRHLDPDIHPNPHQYGQEGQKWLQLKKGAPLGLHWLEGDLKNKYAQLDMDAVVFLTEAARTTTGGQPTLQASQCFICM